MKSMGNTALGTIEKLRDNLSKSCLTKMLLLWLGGGEVTRHPIRIVQQDKILSKTFEYFAMTFF
jgi:hypothetical protein